MTTIYFKNTQNFDQKVNQQQNTVYLEQQTYTRPENFTPTLLVILETFIYSVQHARKQLYLPIKKNKRYQCCKKQRQNELD